MATTKKLRKKKAARKLAAKRAREAEQAQVLDSTMLEDAIAQFSAMVGQFGADGMPLEGEPPEFGWTTADYEAQVVVAEMRESRDHSERQRLAKKAIGISAHCADALIILATESDHPLEKVITELRKAVRAGAEQLGAKVFETHAGFFWTLDETRPFMRAMERLAFYVAAVDPRESIEIYREMIRLDPRDHQGARYELIAHLIGEAMDEVAEALLAAYDNETGAMWTYSRALLHFRSEGETDASVLSGIRALKSNPHVPALLFADQPPTPQVDSFSPGDENEALLYADICHPLWKYTDGARTYLRSVVERSTLKRV